MKIQKTFKVGQWIVHTYYGIGQILKTSKKRLGEIEKDYYCVKISEGEYWLAEENANSQRIRILSSPKKFMEALSILQTHPEKLPDNHRFRASYIDDQIGAGTLITLAALLRDIHGKLLEKGLNITEKQRFKSIRKQFVDEWTLVMGISNEEAVVKLEEVFHQIAKKGKPVWENGEV